MDRKELLDFILGKRSDGNRKSCLRIAIEGARLNAGRNVETGSLEGGFNLLNVKMECKDAPQFNKYATNQKLVGVLIYLISLDTIGSLFEINSDSKKSNQNLSGFKKALKMFAPNLEKKDVDVLYGLRNSLVHNFSLGPNIHKARPGSSCLFTLSFEDDDKLISYPETPWNKDYSINKDKYETVIGAEAFTKLMEEEVLANIDKAYNEGNLDFQSDLEIDEILCRFTIIDEK